MPVLDPELADAFVAMGEREAVGRLRMREARRVEIHADAVAPWPSRSSRGNARAAIALRSTVLPPNSA